MNHLYNTYKSTYILRRFIDSVRRGEKSILVGSDYVVISKNVWDKLRSSDTEFTVVGVDECVRLNKEEL